ncbi:MAG: thioredoxin [Candidatus Omnitrophica bacterium]|nr:thioredoxin [Candidatus Omnitrophota bacterium]MDD5513609.1 thioredoxin [Candidatus Omnitrophota bacterium]
MSPLHFTDSSFKKDVLDSDLPVVVDFWAPWCGPCKMLAPILDELAKEYDRKVRIGKINIDENPKTATHYGVMSIPTVMFFKNGKISGQIVGAVSKQEFKKKIEANL